jgi:hypothetical protein
MYGMQNIKMDETSTSILVLIHPCKISTGLWTYVTWGDDTNADSCGSQELCPFPRGDK